jgi:hypothetical protein
LANLSSGLPLKVRTLAIADCASHFRSNPLCSGEFQCYCGLRSCIRSLGGPQCSPSARFWPAWRGGGIIGTRAVLGEQPDGYTLLAALASIYMILPAQQENLPFDVNRDMIPIGLTAYEGLVMACSPKLGVNSLAEFIALAKKMPDKLVIGTNPAGSLPHVTAKLFVDLTNTGITVVPYSTGGTADAIRDILGGRVHAVIDGWASLRGGIESKDLTPLAILSPEPSTLLPDLPVAAAICSRVHLDRMAGAHRALGNAGAGRACPGRQPAQGPRRSAAAEATSGNRPSVPATLRRRIDSLHRGRAEVLAAPRKEIRDLSRPTNVDARLQTE